MVIDFLMTATCRPSIVHKSLSSFSSMLVGSDFSSRVLYLNVDPVPVGCKCVKVLNVCKKFFGSVVCRTPKKPNFSVAQKWCFGSSKGKLVFNLQDDWTLLERVNLDKMSAFLLVKHRANESIAQARLPYRPNMSRSKMFLSPSLMLGEFCRSFAKTMVSNKNPEVQLKAQGRGRSCVYPVVRRSIVKDIGRKWLKAHGYTRDYGGPRRSAFVRWNNA